MKETCLFQGKQFCLGTVPQERIQSSGGEQNEQDEKPPSNVAESRRRDLRVHCSEFIESVTGHPTNTVCSRSLDIMAVKDRGR